MASISGDAVWSLYLSDLTDPAKRLEDLEQRVIWSSSATSSFPSGKELSQILLQDDIDPTNIANLASQIVRSAPTSSIAALLNCVACHYWRNGSAVIDSRMLENLPNANRKTVCGKVFKKDEIVWTCRTCGKDPTCVQCNNCFNGSDHTDHDVYFHRAQGRGGCCDCGDPEAWAQAGNCSEHKVDSQCEIDPLSVIPEELMRGFRAVVTGVIGIMVSYATGTVRGFESYADNNYVRCAKTLIEQNKESAPMKVRLHNDDVHTYEEVTRVLTSFDISSTVAQAMTTAVDLEGEAAVYLGEAIDPKIRNASRLFRDVAGLLVSITPEKLANLGPNIAAAFQWILTFGNTNDGLRRIITEVLIQETDTLPSCAVAVVGAGVPAPNEIFVKLTGLNETGEPMKLAFPQSVQHLRKDVPARLAQENQSRMMRISPFTVCPRIGLAVLILASPYLSPSITKATNDLVILYQQDAIFKSAFSQVITLLYPALYGLYFRSVGLAKETVFSITVQVYTSDSIVTMMSSEGVSTRPLLERTDFMKIGSGSSKSNVSTPSIREKPVGGMNVREKEDAEAKARAISFGPVNLMEMLTSTFLTLLADVGCTPDREDDRFVSHHSIHTRRYAYLCRDLEYCSDNPWAAIKTLQGIRDSRVINDWLEIAQLLQCMDRFKRRTGTHMEQEDYKWQDAANLVLQLETVSSTFICNALLAPITPYDPDQGASVSLFVCTDDSDLSDVSLHRRFAIGVALDKAFYAMGSWFNAHLQQPSAFRSEDQDLFFDGSGGTCPILILDCPVDFPGIRRYTVSHSPVSVHLPIHRFISKMLDFAAYADLDLKEVIGRLIPTLAFTLADFPLRCLSFCAQVRCGMWRRNGSMPENLAFNYDRPPLCKSLRNTDLTSIQTAILVMGPDTTLALAIDRYEVNGFLENYCNPLNTLLQTDKLLEYRGPLVADLLKSVLLLMTYVPTSLVKMETSESERQRCGDDGGKDEECKISIALKRELSHLLLSGDLTMSISQLQKAKSIIGSTEMVTDKMMRSAIEELCDKRQDLLAGKSTLDPRQLAFDLFDPEYLNLSSQKQQVATDRVREHRKKTSAAIASPLGIPPDAPVISKSALPVPHRDFARIRRLLFQPLTCSLLETCLRCCMVDSKVLGGSIGPIINRVIHIATLQLHCQAEVAANDIKELARAASAEEEEGKGSAIDPDSNEMDVETAHPGGGSEALDCTGAGAAGCFFDLFFSKPNTAPLDDSSAPSTVISNDERPKNDKTSRFRGAGRRLLIALADVWFAGTIRDDLFYHQGLSWVLQQLSVRSPDACALLLEKGITFEFALSVQTSRDAIAKKRQDAQRRAVSAMTKQAASFASALMDDDDDEDMADKQPVDSATVPPSLEDGAPECIFCREKSGDAMGYLSFIQTSSLMKKAVQKHSDCKEMQSVYRAVAHRGVNITVNANETSRIVAHIPHGDHILVGSRAGRWMRVVSPTPGWAPIYQRLAPLPKKQDLMSAVMAGCERYQRLQYEKQASPSPSLEVMLHPVSDLQFNHFGGERLHVSSCGHAMHLKCHARVVDSINNDSRYGSNYEDNQVIDVRKGEMLCPLCKGIGNTILPYTPPHIAAARLSSTTTFSTSSTPSSSSTSSSSTTSSTSLLFSAPPSTQSFSESLGVKTSNLFSLLSTSEINSVKEKSSKISELTSYVMSLLPDKGPELKSTTPTPMTGDFATDMAAASKAARSIYVNTSDINDATSTSTSTSTAVDAYDKVVAGGLFHRDILSHFFPLWHPESHVLHRTSILFTPELARSTHYTWSAAAYTLLSASRSRNWIDKSTTSSPSQSLSLLKNRRSGLLDLASDEKVMSLIYQLLLFLRTVDPTLYKYDTSLLHSGIIGPLGELLSGNNPPGDPYNNRMQVFLNSTGNASILRGTVEPNHMRNALLSQPLATVGTIAYPAPKRQATIIKHGKALLNPLDTSDATPAITVNDLWPFLRTPLLEHDLHVIAIAFVSTATDLPSALAALPLICFARLAQILVEPAATGLAGTNSMAALALLRADIGRSKSRKKDVEECCGKGKCKEKEKFIPPRVIIADESSNYVASPPSQGISWLLNQTVCNISSSSDVSGSRKREREANETNPLDDNPVPALVPIQIPTPPSSLDDLTAALMHLQNTILIPLGGQSSSQLPLSRSQSNSEKSSVTVRKGYDLLSCVVDSWIPFLEFCGSLRAILLSAMPVTVGIKDTDSCADDQAVSQLHLDVIYLVSLLKLQGLSMPMMSPVTVMSPSSSTSSSSSSSSLEDISDTSAVLPDALRAVTQLHQVLSSPGLPEIFTAWGSQAANNTCTPAVAPASSWVPDIESSAGRAIVAQSKIDANQSIQPVKEISEGLKGDVKETIPDTAPVTVPVPVTAFIPDPVPVSASVLAAAALFNDVECDAYDIRYQNAADQAIIDTIEHFEDCQFNGEGDGDDDDEDDNDDDDDDMLGDDALDAFGEGDYGDDDGEGDDDEDYEDEEEYFDSEEEEYNNNDGEDELEGIGFFEQQVATFLADHPGADEDGESPPDISGMMAAVMAQLGMLPDEALPPGLAAIFESLLPGASREAAGATTGSGVRGVWRMLGVDPTNLHVDAHAALLYNNDSPAVHNLAPLRGSVTGRGPIYGLQGSRLHDGYCDLSHLGMGNRHRGGFVSMPLAYTELHCLATFPESLPGQSMEEPAICLLCGQILNAGIRGTSSGSDSTPPGIGECTLHARGCGAGVGVFFLVHKCSVLLMRGSRTCLYPSIYLDQNGDEQGNSTQFCPMFLSLKNFRTLEEMYLNHHVATEVTRRRATQERVTRLNWY